MPHRAAHVRRQPKRGSRPRVRIASVVAIASPSGSVLRRSPERAGAVGHEVDDAQHPGRRHGLVHGLERVREQLRRLPLSRTAAGGAGGPPLPRSYALRSIRRSVPASMRRSRAEVSCSARQAYAGGTNPPVALRSQSSAARRIPARQPSPARIQLVDAEDPDGDGGGAKPHLRAGQRSMPRPRPAPPLRDKRPAARGSVPDRGFRAAPPRFQGSSPGRLKDAAPRADSNALPRLQLLPVLAACAMAVAAPALAGGPPVFSIVPSHSGMRPRRPGPR